MTGELPPLPQDTTAFLDLLIAQRAAGLKLDTFQLAAAVRLLTDALATPDHSDDRRLFWWRVLPVLSTSGESRDRWLHLFRDITAPPAEPKPSTADTGARPASDGSGPDGGLWEYLLAYTAPIAVVVAILIAFALNPNAAPPTIVPQTTTADHGALPKPIPIHIRAVQPQVQNGVSGQFKAKVPDWRAFDLARLLAVLAPIAGLAAWIWLRVRKRRTRLSRQPRDRPANDRQFLGPLQDSVRALLDRPTMRSLARRLHTPILVQTQQLDVLQSVRTTVRRAGLFSPVRRLRRQQPEYLAMIERHSLGDHLAHLNLGLTQGLSEEGVEIRVFHYLNNPQLLTEMTASGPVATDLESLSVDAARQRLIVMGSADPFLQPFSGQPWPWVERFERWEVRALLDPNVRKSSVDQQVIWRPGEVNLAEGGWMIGTGRRSGFASFGERLVTRADTPYLEGRPARPRPVARRDTVSSDPIPREPPPETANGKDDRRATRWPRWAGLAIIGALAMAAIALYIMSAGGKNGPSAPAPGAKSPPSFVPRHATPEPAAPRTRDRRPGGRVDCPSGLVWRQAFAGDHVCVSPATRAQAQLDNRYAPSRINPAGAYGPKSCVNGYVWREARPGDYVCVLPPIRTQAAADNAAANPRPPR